MPHANEAAYPRASLQVKTLIEIAGRPRSDPYNSDPMLIDVILLCAPVVVALPAVVALLTSHASLASRSRVQGRLYGTLLLAEKLPPGVPGEALITHDIDRQTLHVAYLAQYPQRAREIVHVVLIGAGVATSLAAYYLLWWGEAALLVLLIVLGAATVAALWFERALVNFGRNDGVARELFAHFRAPDSLIRRRTELVAKAPPLTVDIVFAKAADVRDAHLDGTVTTLEAVNAVLAKAHAHFDWRREARRAARRLAEADYRTLATRVTMRTHAVSASAYDWLLRHLLGPFFTLRLRFLEGRERRRAAAAERSGDVFEAAWLSAHYRNERRRLAEHWAYLHKVRDPLANGNGAASVNGAAPTREPAPADA